MEEAVEISVENFASICRGCLCDCENSTSFDIHKVWITDDADISRVLSNFVWTRMNGDDPLPKQLCKECVDDLISCYNFVNKCRKSEQTLLALVSRQHCSMKIDKIESLAHKTVDVTEINHSEPSGTLNKGGEKINTVQCSETTSEGEVIEILSDVEMELQEEGSSSTYSDLETTSMEPESPPDQIAEMIDIKDSELSEALNNMEKTAEVECPDTTETDVAESITQVVQDNSSKTSDVASATLETDKLHWMMYCKECDTQFATFAAYFSHSKSEVPDKSHCCRFCGKQFTSQCNLKVHTRAHHKNKKQEIAYPCSICPTTFATHSHLKEHLLNHTDVSPHICPFCKSGFPQASKLKKHIGASVEKTPHICKFCNKKFQHLCTLRKHCSVHHLKRLEGTPAKLTRLYRPHLCPFCKSGFRTTTNLKQHVGLSVSDAPYVCKGCDEIFQHSCVLREHRCNLKSLGKETNGLTLGRLGYRLNTQQNKVAKGADKSQIKHKESNEKGNMESFDKTHTLNFNKTSSKSKESYLVQAEQQLVPNGDLCHVCPFCSLQLKSSTWLNRHLDTNRGEFSCDICGEVFRMHCIMKKHCDIAHSGPQTCPFCKKEFIAELELTKHLEVNTDELPYKCRICPETFQQRCLLRKHDDENHREK